MVMMFMMMMMSMTRRVVSGSDRSRDNPVQGHKHNMCTPDCYHDDTIGVITMMMMTMTMVMMMMVNNIVGWAGENQSTDLEGCQVLLYRCKSETLTRAADDFVF